MNAGTELDRSVREAEAVVYAQYDLKPVEHDVDCNGINVRVSEFGAADAPPFVLLHGIASITAFAAPLIAELAKIRRVIAVDWPGHGLSGPFRPTPGSDLRAHATSVLESILDYFGIADTDIGGHSMGAQFSLYFTVKRPHRVRKVLLLGAPGAGFEEAKPAPLMKVMSMPGLGWAFLKLPLPKSFYHHSNDDMLGRGTLDGYPSEMIDVGFYAARRPGFAPSLAGFFHTFITLSGIRPGVPMSKAELASIKAPVLHLWGEQDLFLKPTAARPSIEAIPNATLVTMTGGHAPWLNEPGRCAAAATEFLS